MKTAPFSVEVPYKTPITDGSGFISTAWQFFFRKQKESVDPLGIEKSFELVNNQASSAEIEGLLFSKEKVSAAWVDYVIQRVTTGGGAVEQIEQGTFMCVYKPTSDTWVLSDGPTTSGVTLSITSLGQVKYTTTNVAGTASISKINFRARTIAMKNQQYSEAG